jgi:hypothetical protein
MCMLFHHINMITGLLAERLNSHNQVMVNVYLSFTAFSYAGFMGRIVKVEDLMKIQCILLSLICVELIFTCGKLGLSF